MMMMYVYLRDRSVLSQTWLQYYARDDPNTNRAAVGLSVTDHLCETGSKQ